MDLRQFQRRFAARVRALREERDLRQEDLENYDLSWKAVQKIEYGITDPKVSTLLKLCRAFKLTLPELLALDAARDGHALAPESEPVSPPTAKRRNRRARRK